MSIDEVISERAPAHGNYDATAAMAQQIKKLMWRDGQVLTPVQDESLDMIATKIARICCGDPNHRDHWVDIAGYATLVLDRLPKETT